MAEYNWRKEREKYRPDFMKQPEPEQPSVPQPPQNRRSYAGVIVAVIAVVVIVVAAVVFAVSRKTAGSGDSAVMLAQAAERYKNAVGLVVLTVELQDGSKIPLPIGTAWAFAPEKFATNAHVALSLREANLKLRQKLAAAKKPVRSVEAQIIVNGRQRQILSVTHVQLHKDYGIADTSRDPDVAALTVEKKHDSCFKIAPQSVLHGLKSGEPIAFLGFPMENLRGGNVNTDNPVASMQSGIIVAVSDFDMKDAGGSGNVLIRHNLPSTGGASGSPIFNRNGAVVGLLHAINVVGQVKPGKSGVTVERAPSGAQINFAIRADLLAGIGSPVPIQEFLK